MPSRPPRPIRAIVVGEDPRVSRALAGLLIAGGGVEVVEEARSSDIEAAIARDCPDLLLIDLDRGDPRSWQRDIAAARAHCRATAVVAIGTSTDMVAAAVAAGADAFVAKLEPAQAVCEVVHAAVEARRAEAGGPAVTGGAAARLLSD